MSLPREPLPSNQKFEYSLESIRKASKRRGFLRNPRELGEWIDHVAPTIAENKVLRAIFDQTLGNWRDSCEVSIEWLKIRTKLSTPSIIRARNRLIAKGAIVEVVMGWGKKGKKGIGSKFWVQLVSELLAEEKASGSKYAEKIQLLGKELAQEMAKTAKMNRSKRKAQLTGKKKEVTKYQEQNVPNISLGIEEPALEEPVSEEFFFSSQSNPIRTYSDGPESTDGGRLDLTKDRGEDLGELEPKYLREHPPIEAYAEVEIFGEPEGLAISTEIIPRLNARSCSKAYENTEKTSENAPGLTKGQAARGEVPKFVQSQSVRMGTNRNSEAVDPVVSTRVDPAVSVNFGAKNGSFWTLGLSIFNQRPVDPEAAGPKLAKVASEPNPPEKKPDKLPRNTEQTQNKSRTGSQEALDAGEGSDVVTAENVMAKFEERWTSPRMGDAERVLENAHVQSLQKLPDANARIIAAFGMLEQMTKTKKDLYNDALRTALPINLAMRPEAYLVWLGIAAKNEQAERAKAKQKQEREADQAKCRSLPPGDTSGAGFAQFRECLKSLVGKQVHKCLIG